MEELLSTITNGRHYSFPNFTLLDYGFFLPEILSFYDLWGHLAVGSWISLRKVAVSTYKVYSSVDLKSDIAKRYFTPSFVVVIFRHGCCGCSDLRLVLSTI